MKEGMRVTFALDRTSFGTVEGRVPESVLNTLGLIGEHYRVAVDGRDGEFCVPVEELRPLGNGGPKVMFPF